MEGSNGDGTLDDDLGNSSRELLQKALCRGDIKAEITPNGKFLTLESRAIMYIRGEEGCSTVYRSQSFAAMSLLEKKIGEFVKKYKLTKELRLNETPKNPGEWCIIRSDLFVCEIE